MTGPNHLNATFSRRGVLRLGTAGVLGLSLPNLLRWEPAQGAPVGRAGRATSRADSCIVIFLNGGPSHLDMWDMKPEAPAEVRGEFQPIATTVPGLQVSEHLPRLAQQMHRATLVRSMHHSVNNAHALAVYTALTGHDRGDAGVIVGNSAEDHPSPGAVASLVRPTPLDSVSHVALPYQTKEGAGGPPQPGFFGGWLGRNWDPLWVLKDPHAADFGVPELTLQGEVNHTRLGARRELLARFNDRWEDAGSPSALDRFQQRAADLLTSQKTQAAFRLDQEPAALREAYGRNIYGQSVLLARRLIEAGTRVVTISWAPDANATWDTHGGNFKKLKQTLLPQFDAACGTLLGDLAARGMLDRTLVAVLGDFGRTPKINNNDAGRDHWNYCYTVLFAGGGVRGGHVHGASDKIGAFPAEKPVTPGDAIATMYELLGIDYRGELLDRIGRPHRIIPKGDAIEGVIA